MGSSPSRSTVRTSEGLAFSSSASPSLDGKTKLTISPARSLSRQEDVVSVNMEGLSVWDVQAPAPAGCGMGTGATALPVSMLRTGPTLVATGCRLAIAGKEKRDQDGWRIVECQAPPRLPRAASLPFDDQKERCGGHPDVLSRTITPTAAALLFFAERRDPA